MKKKCDFCNEESREEDMEEWLDNNQDADGNEYCADCISKIELLMEMEEYDEN